MVFINSSELKNVSLSPMAILGQKRTGRNIAWYIDLLKGKHQCFIIKSYSIWLPPVPMDAVKLSDCPIVSLSLCQTVPCPKVPMTPNGPNGR